MVDDIKEKGENEKKTDRKTGFFLRFHYVIMGAIVSLPPGVAFSYIVIIKSITHTLAAEF